MVRNTPTLMKLSLLGDMDEEMGNYSAVASAVAQIGFWIRQSRVQIPAPLHTTQVSLDKLFTLYLLQFLQLENRNNNCT